MTRLYGRSPRGQRLLGRAPYGHWKTTTFLAGLCHDGIVAPLVLDGPINGRAFLAWVEQFLAPTLQPGQIVIADRLGSHKVAGVREAIEARGAELILLPPYSHDFNPIEQVFAKLKALLRKAEPRTRETLWRTIGEKLAMFSPDECLNYLRHCGYGHPTRKRCSGGAPRTGRPLASVQCARIGISHKCASPRAGRSLRQNFGLSWMAA